VLTIGSLCSGYGGLDIAAEQLTGGTTVWHSEIDPAPARVLQRHWPDRPNHPDLTLIDWATVEPVDVLTAGYPCQPFSQAGLQKGSDDDRHLWPHVAGAIGALRPRLVLLENVAGHLAIGGTAVVADLAALGYVGSWTTLAASDIGACHQRRRLFIAAWPAVADTGGSGRPQAVEHDGGSATTGDGQRVPDQRDRDVVWARPIRGLPGQVSLLPTPRASPNENRTTDRTPAQERGEHGKYLSVEVQPAFWGEYTDAIDRHAHVFQRPAPNPVRTYPQHGKPQLDPVFVEWMMGLPEGWVTGTPGLSRNQQLSILGNGVMPQQADAAYRAVFGANQ
jgi:DNA (cytosine-5)-methyltransferase 1